MVLGDVTKWADCFTSMYNNRITTRGMYVNKEGQIGEARATVGAGH